MGDPLEQVHAAVLAVARHAESADEAHAAALAEACGELTQLCRGADAASCAHRRHAVECGALGAAVKAIDDHVASKHVASAACKLVACLCDSDTADAPAHRDRAAAAGVLEALGRALREHVGSGRVQAWACVAARSVCRGLGARALARKRRAHAAGLTRCAVRALRPQRVGVAVAACVCQLLCALCAGADWGARARRQTALGGRALPALAHAMRAHLGAARLQTHGCLAALALIGPAGWADGAPARAAAALRAGVGHVALAAMSVHAAERDVQLCACKLLSRLLWNAELHGWAVRSPLAGPWAAPRQARQLTLGARAAASIAVARHPASEVVRRAARELQLVLLLLPALPRARLCLRLLDLLVWLEAGTHAATATARHLLRARALGWRQTNVIAIQPDGSSIRVEAPSALDLLLRLWWPAALASALLATLALSALGRPGRARPLGRCVHAAVRLAGLRWALEAWAARTVAGGGALELGARLVCAQPGGRCTVWDVLELLRTDPAAQAALLGGGLVVVALGAARWLDGSCRVVLAPPVCAA